MGHKFITCIEKSVDGNIQTSTLKFGPWLKAENTNIPNPQLLQNKTPSAPQSELTQTLELTTATPNSNFLNIENSLQIMSLNQNSSSKTAYSSNSSSDGNQNSLIHSTQFFEFSNTGKTESLCGQNSANSLLEPCSEVDTKKCYFKKSTIMSATPSIVDLSLLKKGYTLNVIKPPT